MKRFYKLVSTGQEPGGFSICLDAKPVMTPSGAMLLSPTHSLAEAIAAEWSAQDEVITPDSMPLTQILTTALDRVAGARDDMTAMTLRYLDTDLLCYRTQEPEDLAEKQAASWDPFLDWFVQGYAVLHTTTDLLALKQPADAHEKVEKAVRALDAAHFTVLQLLTSMTGSLVLALAFVDGRATAEQLFEAIHIEEHHKAGLYNEDFYGTDPQQEKKQELMKRDLSAAQAFLGFLN